MVYQYIYITWAIIFFSLWLILFLFRKDLRKEIIIISIIFGIGGVLSQFVYIQDWWKPLTLTKTVIGIEDFLIGFFIGGISSVIYEFVFNKKIKKKKVEKKLRTRYLALIFLILFFGSFYILKIGSFFSSLLAFVLCTLIILYYRGDLIKCSFFSGVFMLIIGIGLYFILAMIYPGFIGAFWYLNNGFYSKLLLGVPIGEYIWYFLAGMFIGCLYKYWKDFELVQK